MNNGTATAPRPPAWDSSPPTMLDILRHHEELGTSHELTIGQSPNFLPPASGMVIIASDHLLAEINDYRLQIGLHNSVKAARGHVLDMIREKCILLLSRKHIRKVVAIIFGAGLVVYGFHTVGNACEYNTVQKVSWGINWFFKQGDFCLAQAEHIKHMRQHYGPAAGKIIWELDPQVQAVVDGYKTIWETSKTVLGKVEREIRVFRHEEILPKLNMMTTNADKLAREIQTLFSDWTKTIQEAEIARTELNENSSLWKRLWVYFPSESSAAAAARRTTLEEQVTRGKQVLTSPSCRSRVEAVEKDLATLRADVEEVQNQLQSSSEDFKQTCGQYSYLTRPDFRVGWFATRVESVAKWAGGGGCVVNFWSQMDELNVLLEEIESIRRRLEEGVGFEDAIGRLLS